MGRTHEALLRAEQKFNENDDQRELLENLEPLLIKFELGEAQILKQSFSQLKHSLARLNDFISKPESLHKFNLAINSPSAMEFKRSILRILLKRKEFVLGCIDLHSTNYNNEVIRKVVNKISDKTVRTALRRHLNNLEVLDKFLTKEYLKILESKKRIRN